MIVSEVFVTKQSICFFLILCLLGAVPAAAQTDSAASVQAETAAWLLENTAPPSVGSVGGEWLVLALARSGAPVPPDYFDGYYSRLCSYVTERNGVLHSRKYTEYARVVLALSAIGQNPADVAGYDLLAPLADYDKVVWQGINGPVSALLALDAGAYAMPACPAGAVQATRQQYVAYILSRQEPDGGFALSAGGGSNVDITAMALQALSGYCASADVAAAVGRALDYISAQQCDSGGFADWDGENAESCAQVITALSALGVDLSDPRFVKNGRTVLDRLLDFYRAESGFAHTAESGVNQMATEQSLYALAAYERYQKGENKLFDMTDVQSESGETITAAPAWPVSPSHGLWVLAPLLAGAVLPCMLME